MVIRRSGSIWKLFTVKKPRRRLGTFTSLKAAKKRERQIQWFKNRK